MPSFSKYVDVVGPTASGKTSLACALAQRFGGEIVGVDASQIYQGFDIGTGKATKAQLNGVKHHNLDIVPPNTDYNAARFVRETSPIVEQVLERSKLPIFCGGTGLYFRALREGLCKAPKVPHELRDEVLREIHQYGVVAMHEALSKIDPNTSARVHERDKQRIERAISVYRFTGKPLSQWMVEDSFTGLKGHWLVLGLRWDTSTLRKRIEARVEQMVSDGWLEEVQGIVEDGYGEEIRAFTAIGYRVMLDVLEGRKDLESAVEEITHKTQRYAKRQMTWFRREADVVWLDCPIDELEVFQKVSAFLKEAQ